MKNLKSFNEQKEQHHLPNIYSIASNTAAHAVLIQHGLSIEFPSSMPLHHRSRILDRANLNV